MFTGIVEELGRVERVARRGEVVVVDIGSGVVTADLGVGDSIAVDGVCLTAVAVRSDGFTVELAPETVRRTTLGDRAAGAAVNLERPIAPAGRMGGHFVQGHIDGTGRVVSLEPEGEAILVRFEAPPEVMRYVVPKGFVAVDGVSLTVVDIDIGTGPATGPATGTGTGPATGTDSGAVGGIDADHHTGALAGSFLISYIPHTLAHTTAGAYTPGRIVNLEPDILAKYVERFLAKPVPIVDDGLRTVANPSNPHVSPTDSEAGT